MRRSFTIPFTNFTVFLIKSIRTNGSPPKKVIPKSESFFSMHLFIASLMESSITWSLMSELRLA